VNPSWGDEIDLKEIKKFAESGYVDAQLILGLKYLFGNGVPKDNDEAVKWLRKAAEQGETEAQVYLDAMYNKQNIPFDDGASSQVSKKTTTKAIEQAKLNITQDSISPGRYTVYLHYSGEKNKKLIEELAIFLKNQGFEVPGIERFNYKNRDIRYFHKEDKSGALLLKKHLTQFITLYTDLKNTNIKIFNLSHKYPNAKKGVLELWVTF
jgi:hypothetical protein